MWGRREGGRHNGSKRRRQGGMEQVIERVSEQREKKVKSE